MSIHLGCPMDCPQLAAAPQAVSGTCFNSSWTTLSLLPHAWVWDRFSPPGITCSKRKGGNTSLCFHAQLLFKLPSTPGKGGHGFGMLLG